MKSIKRFATVLLALVMIFAVAATAAAAGTDGVITVSNPLEGQTYTAYKIFDVTYNADQSSYAYSIAVDSEWYSVVNAYAGISLTKAAVGNQYVVEKNADFSAAGFAGVLKAALDGKTGITLTNKGDGTVSASNLELGYYFVSSTSGALCNLTTTNPTATIHDKNDVPFAKVDDRDSVAVGEVVNYTIIGKVPDTTGFDTYEYTIKDTMSAGLSFNKDVSISVGGAELADDKYELSQTDSGFTLTVNVKELQDKVGQAISVTYTATVNENAVAVISKNSATLTYSNDPANSENKITTPADEESVYSAKIVIDKFEKNNEAKKLANAKFVLKNAEGNYYKFTPAAGQTPATVTWVADKSAATEVITDINGAAEFKGLKDGRYQLEETAAPAGYNMLTAPVEVVINGSVATAVDLSALTVTADVENNTGTTLPETGGIGTTVFYVLGGLLVVGAAVMLITKKRMHTAE